MTENYQKASQTDFMKHIIFQNLPLNADDSGIMAEFLVREYLRIELKMPEWRSIYFEDVVTLKRNCLLKDSVPAISVAVRFSKKSDCKKVMLSYRNKTLATRSFHSHYHGAEVSSENVALLAPEFSRECMPPGVEESSHSARRWTPKKRRKDTYKRYSNIHPTKNNISKMMDKKMQAINKESKLFYDWAKMKTRSQENSNAINFTDYLNNENIKLGKFSESCVKSIEISAKNEINHCSQTNLLDSSNFWERIIQEMNLEKKNKSKDLSNQITISDHISDEDRGKMKQIFRLHNLESLNAEELRAAIKLKIENKLQEGTLSVSNIWGSVLHEMNMDKKFSESVHPTSKRRKLLVKKGTSLGMNAKKKLNKSTLKKLGNGKCTKENIESELEEQIR